MRQSKTETKNGVYAEARRLQRPTSCKEQGRERIGERMVRWLSE